MSKRSSCTVLAATLLLALVQGVRADDQPMQVEQPKEEKTPRRFDEPARVLAAPRIGVHSSVQSGFGSSSISRSTINGVTKIVAREDRATTRITDDPAEGITVETGKTYDRSNMEELKDSHPNVYSYLKKAPQGMGPTKFRVTIEVAEVYEAKSADELKENHPDAFEIYQKYMKENRSPRIPPIRLDIPDFDEFRKGIELKPVDPDETETNEKPGARKEIETEEL